MHKKKQYQRKKYPKERILKQNGNENKPKKYKR